MAKKVEAASEYERHRSMMLNPERWPAWPYLPLKRRTKAGIRTAVLVAAPRDGRTVAFVVGNIFMVDQVTLDGVEKRTVESVLADGWVVD